MPIKYYYLLDAPPEMSINAPLHDAMPGHADKSPLADIDASNDRDGPSRAADFR